MSDLRYRLTADAKKLEQTLKKVSPAFEKMRKQAEDQLDKLNKKFDIGNKFTIAAAGATAFGTATAAAVKLAVSEMDTLQKSADQAGTSVERMAAAELAAARGGSNLEQISVALGKVAKEAKAGEDSFDVFARYADEIKSIGPGATATARAIELFGEEGAKLLPVLLKGSEGLQQAREDAERLGLTFSGATGRQVEEFNDRMSDFENLARGAARQLTSELIPGLNAYSEAMLKASTETGGMNKLMSGIATVTKVVISLMDGVSTGFELVGKTLGAFLAQLGLMVTAGVSVMSGLATGGISGWADNWVAAFDRSSEAGKIWVADMKSTLDEANTRLSALWGPKAEGDGPEGKLQGAFVLEGPSLDDFLADKKLEDERRKAAKQRYEQAEREATSAAERIAKAVEEKQKEMSEAAAASRAERARIFLSDLNKGLDELGGDFAVQDERAAAFLDRLRNQVDKAGEEIEASFAEKARFIQGVAQTVGDGIADALFGPSEESLDAFLKRWLESLARMGINAAVGAIGGAITPGFASGGYVSGAGTGTSDSILARLSDGEFVIRKAAVDKYGPGTFAKLNSMQLPGRADGGMVGGGGGGDVAVVNLFSDEELARFMASRRGQRIIMNSIQRSDSMNGRGG